MRKKAQKQRVLAAMDGHLVPPDVIRSTCVGGEICFAIRPLGATLYAPAEGVLAESGEDGFLLYIGGGARLRLSFSAARAGAPPLGGVHLNALVEPGAPLRAGQVLAHLEHAAPSSQAVLLTKVQYHGHIRFCRAAPLLSGGRTAVLLLQTEGWRIPRP